MKATVIVDNIASDGMNGEWGLCIFIEYEGQRILLDTGASGLFAENAEKMGLSLKSVDYGVLSHAHYDHANGMEQFFQINPHASFYVQASCAANCYHKKGLLPKYIGIPKHMMRRFPERICLSDGDRKLSDGVFLVPHKTAGLEQLGKRENMYRREGLRFRYDDFSHEQSLVFETAQGLVIFNGCCHGGAANVIREVSETFPDKNVYALIGGFHLYNKTEEETRSLARKIRETGIRYVCTGHCTGKTAYGILQEELGDTLHMLHVGLEMEF